MRPQDELIMAIRNNHHQRVVELIKMVDHRKEIVNNRTPIQQACELGHWDCVEAIAKNKKTNARDEAGYGHVLFKAVRADRLGTAKMLLEAGALYSYWVCGDTEDNCLHVAVRNRNAPMIALLFSFGFDLTKTNKAGQTPLQLADNLNVTSLDEGYKIYNDAISLKLALIVFIQSMRKRGSAFHKYPIPHPVCELIVSFLSKQTPALKQTVRSTQSSLVRISANCFLTAYSGYSVGMFRRHSSASKELVAELKTTLQANHDTTKNIGSAVNTYLKKNKGKKTGTLGLLDKYKLATSQQHDQEEKLKNNSSSARLKRPA